MKVTEVMTGSVKLCRSDQTIRDAARLMKECDIGALPVSENDRLVGMITDRDIAIRAVCEGKGPDTPIRDVMTKEVKYCFDDEEIGHAAHNMGDQQIRRLPVMNRSKRLVGVLAIGDVAAACAPKPTGEALSQISRPGNIHH